MHPDRTVSRRQTRERRPLLIAEFVFSRGADDGRSPRVGGGKPRRRPSDEFYPSAVRLRDAPMGLPQPGYDGVRILLSMYLLSVGGLSLFLSIPYRARTPCPEILCPRT